MLETYQHESDEVEKSQFGAFCLLIKLHATDRHDVRTSTRFFRFVTVMVCCKVIMSLRLFVRWCLASLPSGMKIFRYFVLQSWVMKIKVESISLLPRRLMYKLVSCVHRAHLAANKNVSDNICQIIKETLKCFTRTKNSFHKHTSKTNHYKNMK